MAEITAAMPMPKYRSHKEVWALRVARVYKHPLSEDFLIYPIEEGFHPVTVKPAVVARYMPVPGDYLVTYADGYQSISPAKAFEEGYTRI